MVEKIKPPGSDFSMRLGSSCLERVVIPYTNSSSTNPSAKVLLFLELESRICYICFTKHTAYDSYHDSVRRGTHNSRI